LILFGSATGCIALIGFGLDSIVESLSGVVLIWSFRNHGKISPYEDKVIEKKAAKFVALTFFVLGFYVLFESAETLITQKIVEPALPCIIIVFLSAVLMPLLAFRSLATGTKLQLPNRVLTSRSYGRPDHRVLLFQRRLGRSERIQRNEVIKS